VLRQGNWFPHAPNIVGSMDMYMYMIG